MQRPDSPAIAEEGPRKDKSYRRYASNVERALSLFDTALQEWADYIAFLGRLQKALQSKPADAIDIPHKATVAKRLAQCLAPALPSGVHKRTLEVYAFVFSVLGKDGLSRDLALWLPGISPTLSFASLSIKPFLLSLFETFVVPLNPNILRSALKAIVLALLPGLEEETSEEFERTLDLINQLRDAVSQDVGSPSSHREQRGSQYMWQSMFLAAVTSSSRRQGVLAYMGRELPTLGQSASSSSQLNNTRDGDSTMSATNLRPEIEAIISPEPGLLIRCFAAGLQDEQLLVQRGFLDLLVTHLPLDATVFHQRVVPKDLELLVIAAVSVVARREMSLNRRLWTWLLGPDTSKDAEESTPGSPNSPAPTSNAVAVKHSTLSQAHYFERYGLEPLISGLLKMVRQDLAITSERVRPFRICLSLMDRWEIGGLVIPRVFLPAMESMWRYQKTGPAKDTLAEVLRSATVFFDGIESSLIWADLNQVLMRALSTQDQNSDKGLSLNRGSQLELVLFILTNFNVREEEMLTVHIPLSSLAFMINLRFSIEAAQMPLDQRSLPLIEAFKVATSLLELIPQRVLSPETLLQEVLPNSSRSMLTVIKQFYEKLRNGSEDVVPPLQNHVVREAVLHNACQITVQTLSSAPAQVEYLEKAVNLLDKILRKVPGLDDYEFDRLISAVSVVIERPAVGESSLPFPIVAAIVYLLEIVKDSSSPKAWESKFRIRLILPRLLTALWDYTSPSRPSNNVEAVRSFWRIHWLSPDIQLVEGSISTLLFHGSTSDRSRSIQVENARRFATIWAHSNSGSQSSIDRRSIVGARSNKSGERASGRSKEPIILTRPLLLLLDLLSDPSTELYMFITSWLQSMSNPEMILDTVIQCLNQSVYAAKIIVGTQQVVEEAMNDADHVSHYIDQCLYYLQSLSRLIEVSAANIWASLSSPRGDTQDPDDQTVLSLRGLPNSIESETTNLRHLANICMTILRYRREDRGSLSIKLSALRQKAVSLLQQLFFGPSVGDLIEMDVEHDLLEHLLWAVDRVDLVVQVPLMDIIFVVLKTQKTGELPSSHRRQTSRETVRSASQLSLATDQGVKDQTSTVNTALLDCLTLGISSPTNHPILDHWIQFMGKCLPLYSSTTFQNLMLLVDCFIKTIDQTFQRLRALFQEAVIGTTGQGEPIILINALLNGLEQVLARGHDQLIQDEMHTNTTRSPEQSQGFFGNIVSGVFSPEAQKARSATANDRLTVLLCFKDAVRLCFSMWSWGDIGLGDTSRETPIPASFNYTSIRLRNRSRRMLEHLFAAEALECLETLIEFWNEAYTSGGIAESNAVLNLLQNLEASRPKNTIPALFNAIYSRTNPNVIDPGRKSTLTSQLSDTQLAVFLIIYTRSMEDDALDEIWTDCMTFLRDVLGNPLPHRQTLPTLLEFTAILGEKIDNTNFGEQRKMRRDIGELFVRLLAAALTVKPLAFSSEPVPITNGDKVVLQPKKLADMPKMSERDDINAIVASILPNISKILVDTDRITAAIGTISSQILVPTLKWKTFPHNVLVSTLEILKTMSKIPEASKSWRKDVVEALYDPRFFTTCSLDLIQNGWMPIMRQLVLLDKDRMPELLSRLSAPASAGIMFGVGASSARLEADRKAQLNLRRIAFLVLSADHDSFITNLNSLQDKLIDLMTASAASSPSSITRAEVFMVFRSLMLKITPIHLASLWPTLSTELYETLQSLNNMGAQDRCSTSGIVQAAKLLETLLIIGPDDFQLREWLFITDTIDAVYRPLDWQPVALVDSVAEALDAKAGTPHSAITPALPSQQGRRPLLTWKALHDVPREDVIDRILRPFLNQLSINAFESMYHMEPANRSLCNDDLLRDLFDDSTLV